VRLTDEQWRYAFTNTFSEEESLALYKRYQVPAAGHIIWNSVLANLIPGPQDAFVHYDNDRRVPLLFISGGADTLMPPEVQRSNAEHYTSQVITEVKEYEGFCHLLPLQKGWEQIADAALAWALEHAGKRLAHASMQRQDPFDVQLMEPR
jgi:pimeloyl-ACP methyl ester carboxylesterase